MNLEIHEMRALIPESIRYFKGALLFSRFAESIYQNEEYPDRYTSYHVNCASSILFSYLALEAHINELIYLLTDSNDISKLILRVSYDLDESTREKIKRFIKLEKDSTLEKYEFVALLIQDYKLDKGENLYQNVDLLSKLRNLLTHYKMKSSIVIRDGNLVDEIVDLEIKLRGRFDLNPISENDGLSFLDNLRPYFPDKVVSLGATRWAYRAVYDFVNDFHTRIGLESHNVLPEITEEA